jgi:hypothetical protein
MIVVERESQKTTSREINQTGSAALQQLWQPNDEHVWSPHLGERISAGSLIEKRYVRRKSTFASILQAKKAAVILAPPERTSIPAGAEARPANLADLLVC